MALVHGIGEHSGRYTNLVQHLTARGIAVYGFDQRGHGRSPGRRGHIIHWSEYREDVRAFLEQVRQQARGRPVFLFGHSMGALVVLDYLLFYPEGLAGVIVSGAPLQPTGVAKPHLVLLARALCRIWPSFSVAIGFDLGLLSRDPVVVQACREDPLVHSRASVRWGTEALAAVERVRSRLGEIELPMLVLHGAADRINAAEGSKELFAGLASRDKQLHIYPEGAHEPHNDIDHPQVMADVERWLEQHLDRGPVR